MKIMNVIFEFRFVSLEVESWSFLIIPLDVTSRLQCLTESEPSPDPNGLWVDQVDRVKILSEREI